MSGAQEDVLKMKMKLFIDKKSNKVMYAEAGKDCVDFLLHAFSMPLGSAVRLLLSGCGIKDMYTSIEDLDIDYLAKPNTKMALLNPYSASISFSAHYWHSDDCKFAYGPQSRQDNNQSTLSSKGGYVKENATYMITDGLAVKPLSSTSMLALLSQLDVKNVGSITEVEVSIDTALGMELLKTSLVSNTVLTDTFIAKINAK